MLYLLSNLYLQRVYKSLFLIKCGKARIGRYLFGTGGNKALAEGLKPTSAYEKKKRKPRKPPPKTVNMVAGISIEGTMTPYLNAMGNYPIPGTFYDLDNDQCKVLIGQYYDRMRDQPTCEHYRAYYRSLLYFGKCLVLSGLVCLCGAIQCFYLLLFDIL